MKRRHLSRPPKALRRRDMHFDHLALVPASLLPHKATWQELANKLPRGQVLIVVPAAGKAQRTVIARALTNRCAAGTLSPPSAQNAYRRRSSARQLQASAPCPRGHQLATASMVNRTLTGAAHGAILALRDGNAGAAGRKARDACPKLAARRPLHGSARGTLCRCPLDGYDRFGSGSNAPPCISGEQTCSRPQMDSERSTKDGTGRGASAAHRAPAAAGGVPFGGRG